MKAIILDGKRHAYPVERPIPEPKPGCALVRVKAAGICGTDLELLYHADKQSDIIPGHEVSGVVEQVNGCTEFKPGDRVFINCHITCHECEHCKAGDFIFCKQMTCIGFDEDGGDAEYIAVSEKQLRHLPDDLSFEQGVLLTDALGTPYHAARLANIVPGELVGISGAGPLGMMCILSVVHMGGVVVAIDVVDERLEAARSFGATYTINGRGDVQAEVNKLTDGRGLGKIIDCSGNARAIKTDLEVLRNRGMLVQVGVCTEITLNFYDMVVSKEITIKGSRNFHDTELPGMIDLVRTIEHLADVVTHRFSLDEADEAFRLGSERKGLKLVFTP